MIVGSQLFVGEKELNRFNVEEIESIVRGKIERARIDFLAIWCPQDSKHYDVFIHLCDELGVIPYLWFPVLADIDAFKIETASSVQLFDDSRGNGHYGKWRDLGKDEDFLFICPNDSVSVGRNFEFFVQLLDTYKFGGVMLDRIRYPSFANGIESLFTCFCDQCIDGFSGTPHLRELKRQIKNRLQDDTISFIENGSTVESLLFAGGLRSLSEFRKKSISRVVSRFAEQARAREVTVGLDLFAPSIAGSVGQDYNALLELCDWVKPMLYCFAMGPAGLPLEIACLVNGINDMFPKMKREHVERHVDELLGLDCSREVNLLDMFDRELEIIATLNKGSKKILAGIEAIDNERIGLSISPANIRDYLEQIDGHADGIVASWNILYFSDSNLRQLSKE